MHYYKFNIGDYSSHTNHLDIAEDLAYRRMLDWCYLHESPLPDSTDQIARLIRMRTHGESIAVVLREFFTLGEYGWYQPKVEKEIEAYQAKSKKAKESAAARWGKRDANALQAQTERNANHKPLTINHKPLTNTIDQSEIDGEFDRAWSIYEKKGNRKTSKSKFSKLSKEKRQAIFNHLPAYIQSTPDKQFRKNFETYINQEAWNDEVTIHEINSRPNQPRKSLAERTADQARAIHAQCAAEEANQRAVDEDGSIIPQQVGFNGGGNVKR